MAFEPVQVMQANGLADAVEISHYTSTAFCHTSSLILQAGGSFFCRSCFCN